MKYGRSLLKMAWLLVGVLVISAVLSTLSKSDLYSDPDPTSFSPSGSAALVEVLKRTGLNVEIDRKSRPVLNEGDLAILFIPEFFKQDYDLAGEPTSKKKPYDRTLQSLRDSLARGAVVLALPYPEQFQVEARALAKAKPTVVVSTATEMEKTISYRVDRYPDQVYSDLGIDEEGFSLWMNKEDEDDAVVVGVVVGKGRVVVMNDGLLATNRFIDQHENAQMMVDLIQSLKQDGGRIVMPTAVMGHARDPGLFARIGTWAQVAWYQLLFAGIVVVLTLGARFGLPERTRRTERGSRELVDAIADTLKRGRKGSEALNAAIKSADQEIRLGYKIPRDASAAERDRLLPEPLLIAFRVAEEASRDPRLKPSQAQELAENLEREVQEAIQNRHASVRQTV